ncbi:DUF3783 domain-containing protein [Pseudoflavonifractor phocaeensis]|uniref:DUF3783 domain-containing protein n=1 Tax=Pseudoflavonifractor phocaeensis TaxID=1870988 RepID=UPI00195D7780|nr:DUF3783 domain-containing protein [Pseudoflavonifractor phocaeensis]MBM6886214.1 DUF3783 domain-containing protein [Pseudoflavonifractor phocaeensis]
MNHPMVLLYNLNNEKGGKIRRMCLPLGLRTRLVEPAEYGLTLSQLVEGQPPETPWAGECFSEELLLLVNCPGPLLDRFLQGFRRNKIPPVGLKAVLTPTNSGWTSLELREELAKEREAIRQGQGAHSKEQEG